MTWNHRVVRQRKGDETWLGIHEAFYGDDGKLSWTENPVDVVGETVDDLRWTLERMLAALDEPIINEDAELARKDDAA